MKEPKKAPKAIDRSFLILVVLVAIAMSIAFWIGGGQLVLSGIKVTGQLIGSVWLRLVLGVTLGGLIQVLIPPSLIIRWVGPASGLRGLLIGSYIGLFIVGGPYVRIPIIASVYRSGAGGGPVIGMIISACLISINMLVVWRIPFMGVEMALAQYIVSFILPPIAGFIAAAALRRLPPDQH